MELLELSIAKEIPNPFAGPGRAVEEWKDGDGAAVMETQ